MVQLLKLHQTVSSNLLKRKQSSRKTSIVCRWLKIILRFLILRYALGKIF